MAYFEEQQCPEISVNTPSLANLQPYVLSDGPHTVGPKFPSSHYNQMIADDEWPDAMDHTGNITSVQINYTPRVHFSRSIVYNQPWPAPAPQQVSQKAISICIMLLIQRAAAKLKPSTDLQYCEHGMRFSNSLVIRQRQALLSADIVRYRQDVDRVSSRRAPLS